MKNVFRIVNKVRFKHLGDPVFQHLKSDQPINVSRQHYQLKLQIGAGAEASGAGTSTWGPWVLTLKRPQDPLASPSAPLGHSLAPLLPLCCLGEAFGEAKTKRLSVN